MPSRPHMQRLRERTIPQGKGRWIKVRDFCRRVDEFVKEVDELETASIELNLLDIRLLR